MSSQQKYDRSDIRRLNAVSVLNQLREKGAMSRANIAAELGLTRATVSNIVMDLMNASLVSETEYDASGMGRPGLLLKLNPNCGALIALDIDLDRVTLLLTDFGQVTLWRDVAELMPGSSPETTLEIAAGLVEKAFEHCNSKGLKCFGICMALAGLVDREFGQLAYGPTSGWQHVPMKAPWEARFGVPVYVENEAHAGAIGAYHRGAQSGTRNIIYLSLGVGLAAGVFVDGALLRGEQGFAGQVGHTAFMDDGIKCKCGKKGCWVTEIGADAVLRKLDFAGVKLLHKGDAGLDWVETVISKAKSGDTAVLAVLNSVGEQVGLGAACLVQTFNPSLVIIGGRMADLMKYAEPSIRKAILAETLPYMAEPLKVVISTAGEDPLRGGIASVFDATMKNPMLGALAVS